MRRFNNYLDRIAFIVYRKILFMKAVRFTAQVVSVCGTDRNLRSVVVLEHRMDTEDGLEAGNHSIFSSCSSLVFVTARSTYI